MYMLNKNIIVFLLTLTGMSSPAIAWTTGGSGGTSSITGRFNVVYSNPWEILVGGKTGLNASINKCDKNVTINVGNSIPVLGIRARAADALFKGANGITPQIDYHGSVDLDGFSGRNVTTLSVPLINEADGSRLGSLTVPFSAGAESTWKTSSNSKRTTLYAAYASKAYFGGLPKVSTSGFNGWGVVNAINPDVASRYNQQGTSDQAQNDASEQTSFTGSDVMFSSFYGAGIPANSQIKLSLNQCTGYQPVYWKASIRITVSYV